MRFFHIVVASFFLLWLGPSVAEQFNKPPADDTDAPLAQITLIEEADPSADTDAPPEQYIAAYGPGFGASLLRFRSVHDDPETPEEAVAEIKQPEEAVPLAIDAQHIVQRGDTFAGLLIKAGITPAEADRAIRAITEVFDPRRLRPGLAISMQLQPNEIESKSPELLSIAFAPEPAVDVSVIRGEDGSFTAKSLERPLTLTLAYGQAAINSSLYEAGVKARLLPSILLEFVNLYSFEVDFQRDIQPEDSFEVVYEQYEDETGELVRVGDILVASMTLSGKTRTYYRFVDNNEEAEYFEATGSSARRSLLKTPTDATRISSGFGKRRHPILGYTRMHRGVDFAAPTGTPVYAAGDGVIEMAGWNGGYGNYIRIRHNTTHKTAYAHLHRFARGIRPGVRVKQRQVIGYIGSTGQSTGPHLHYEVLINNEQVNPQTIRVAAGRSLKGEELKRFKAEVEQMTQRIAALREENSRQRLYSSKDSGETACTRTC